MNNVNANAAISELGPGAGRSDELPEQRRGAFGPRLELGVELRRHEERVVAQLDHLHEALVRGRPADDQAGGLEPPAQEVVDLVAVAVALVDHGVAVDLPRPRPLVHLDRVSPEPHRAAHVGDLLLLGQQVDHRERGLGIELGRVRPVHSAGVAGELGDRDLHAQADPQVGDLLLAGHPRGGDLALDAAAAEAARNEDPVGASEPASGLRGRELLGVDPVDLDPAAVLEPRVAQRLDHGEVGVLELHVLPDERDLHRLRGLVGALDELLPAREMRLPGLEPEVVDDEVVDLLFAEVQRDLVDVVDIAGRDHCGLREAREQGDLAADLLGQRALGAADHHVGRDADAPQLVDGVLRRLRLQLAGVADVGHEREVDEHAAGATGVDRELADGLEERQGLDVADGAADLRDHHVDIGALRDHPNALLDLVGDVRDDLDGRAEVVAAALAADDRVVDRAGRDVGAATGVRVGEALIVAEVQVRLGAILGDEDLAVLVRRHRAGVDVDVRVELLEGDREAARHEQAPDRRGGDALPQRRDDTAGDEDEAGGSAEAGCGAMWVRHAGDVASRASLAAAGAEPIR